MGWYGTYCSEGLRSIKAAIEKDFNSTGFKPNGDQVTHKVLTHSFRLGQSYMAVEIITTQKDGHSQEIKVIAVVTLWRYSKKNQEVMLKTMDKTCGPCYFKPTMKLLKLLTPTDNTYAFNWRVACWKNFKNIPKCYRSYKEEVEDVI